MGHKTMKNAWSMPKGTSQDEVTSKSETIKPLSLATIELHLSEGISQLFSSI